MGQVEVTGIEVGDKRVDKSSLEDVDTIWATSVEIPARIGFSVDLHGKVDSYKLDLERDFEIAPGMSSKLKTASLRYMLSKPRKENSLPALQKQE